MKRILLQGDSITDSARVSTFSVSAIINQILGLPGIEDDNEII